MSSSRLVYLALPVGLLLTALGRSSSSSSAGPLHFAPGSEELYALLKQAALELGLEVDDWTTEEMSELVRKESGGWIGRPNYTWGDVSSTDQADRWPDEVWAVLRSLDGDPPAGVQSSATGLGQLLGYNVRAYYPSGLKGIGEPLEEAVGMIRYVLDRYGSPAVALSMHGREGSYTHAVTGEELEKTFTEGY